MPGEGPALASARGAWRGPGSPAARRQSQLEVRQAAVPALPPGTCLFPVSAGHLGGVAGVKVSHKESPCGSKADSSDGLATRQPHSL